MRKRHRVMENSRLQPAPLAVRSDPRTAAPSAQSLATRALFVRPIVFLGGLTSIGIELAASRLLAPYFGASTFIWANVIGLTLAYLSLGYYLGGRLADRRPYPWLLYTITAVAAFTAGLVPIMSRPILSASLRAFDRLSAGALYGSLIGVILLFAVPVTLLGFVTPFAIRLRLDDLNAAGNTAGGIYALSTVGSIAGSFLPVLVLIPVFGTARTFLILSLSLLLPSLGALVLLRARGPALVAALLVAALVGITVAAPGGPIKPPEQGKLIYEGESEYNYIQVMDDHGTRLLGLNEGHAIHSIYNSHQLLTGGPWDYFMVGPLFNSPASRPTAHSALQIGLAGGTGAREITAAYGQIPIDGVEIDPEVARVGRTYFALDPAHLPNVNVIVSDGRYFLRTTNRRYDLVGIDAYRQPYIPFQLTSREFFQEVADHLNPNGSVVVNVGRTETDYRLVDVIASTMRAVFPSVYVIDVELYTNSMVVATRSPTEAASFARNVAALPAGSVLRTVGEQSLASGHIRSVKPGGRVFTDDHAPVEQVVDEIILDVARGKEQP